MTRTHSLLIAVLAALLALPAAAQETLAIKNAKIYTAAGQTIEDGTVLIQDGKIAKIGPAKDVEVPWGAKVINGKGKVLVPGLVVAHTYSGTDTPNENLPIAPFVSTVDSVDPSSLFFEGQRREGVTTVGVFPGNSQPIAGQGIIVKLRADTVVGMLVQRDVALKVSLSTGRPRMQVMAQIRKAFEQAIEAKEKHAEAKKKAAEAKKKTPNAKVAEPKPIDFKVQPLLDALAGKLPLVVHCARPGDVLRAIDLRTAHPKLQMTLVLSGTAFRAHAAIAKAKLPVICDPGLEHRERDLETDRETLHPIASVLRKAGLEPALSPQHRARTLVTGHLWYQAATAVKWGLPTDEALKAITLWPARALGLDKRIGSIEVGKDADVVLLSGEPFRIKTFVERVVIDGEVRYRRDKDPWLERLYYRPKASR